MQQNTRSDIESAADIDRLVEVFYAYVLADPIIGFFFTDIAGIDLAMHLPKISAFWQLQLLGKIGYRGETFAVHKDLHSHAQLTADHFHRWLFLFERTVDELFEGPRANIAKQRAHAIARSMQRALANRPPSPERIEALRGVQQMAPRRRKTPD